MLPSFRLKKDANLQVFKPISEGKSKKDANLQEFLANLEKRAGFVENSCRFAGILKFLARTRKKTCTYAGIYVIKVVCRGTSNHRTPSGVVKSGSGIVA